MFSLPRKTLSPSPSACSCSLSQKHCQIRRPGKNRGGGGGLERGSIVNIRGGTGGKKYQKGAL